MKRVKAAVLAGTLVVGLAMAGGAAAGDKDIREYLYKNLFDDPAFVARLPQGVKYYFGDQPAAVKSEIGPTKSSRKRPTPARKTPISVACRQLAGDALIAMGLDAQRRGGNAVVGIKSVLGEAELVSTDRFKCGVGLQLLSVNLAGTVAVVE